MSIGERLKRERERLGLTQAAMAGLAGATSRAQFKWEQGLTSPTAAYLTAIAAAGADVGYILTGVKASDAMRKHLSTAAKYTLESNSDEELREKLQKLFVQGAVEQATPVHLKPDQALLVYYFDQANEAGKQAILTMSAAIAKQGG